MIVAIVMIFIMLAIMFLAAAVFGIDLQKVRDEEDSEN